MVPDRGVRAGDRHSGGVQRDRLVIGGRDRAVHFVRRGAGPGPGLRDRLGFRAVGGRHQVRRGDGGRVAGTAPVGGRAAVARDAAAQGPRDQGERLAGLAGVGNGYPPGAAVTETQRSRRSVDDEYPVLAAAEREVVHRGPVVFLAVPLAELQRRRRAGAPACRAGPGADRGAAASR